jgi:hypothetical protein
MGANPRPFKETNALIARLLAAIEDPTNPPDDDERDELITAAERWLRFYDED